MCLSTVCYVPTAAVYGPIKIMVVALHYVLGLIPFVVKIII